jgi:hypothetical protein
VTLGLKVLLELKVLTVMMDMMVLMVLKVLRVPPVLKVLMAQQVYPVLTAHKVTRVLKETKETQVPLEELCMKIYYHMLILSLIYLVFPRLTLEQTVMFLITYAQIHIQYMVVLCHIDTG